MSILSFIMAWLAAYLALEYWIVPMLDKRWRADRSSAAIGRAATLSVARGLRTLAAMAIVAGSIAALFILLLKATSGMVSDFAAALTVLRDLNGFLSSTRTALSTFVFIVTAGVFIYFGRRFVKMKMTDVYKSAVDKEVARLKHLFDVGQWEEMEDTHEMKTVRDRFASLNVMLEQNAQSITAAQRTEIDRQLDQLRTAWMTLDLQRRMQPSWNPDDVITPDPTSVSDRLWRAVVGSGVLKGAGKTSRLLANTAMVLVFLSLFGFASVSVSAEMDGQSIRLSELAIHKDKEKALQSVEEHSANVKSSSQIDDSVANALAAHFENAFANSEVVRAAGTAARQTPTPELREFVLREQILANVADDQNANGLARHSGVDGAPDLSPDEKATLRASTEPHPNGPRTELGRRVANDISATPELKQTRGWQKLVAAYRSGSGPFGASPQFSELSTDLIGDAVGNLLNEVVPAADSEAGKVMNRLLRSASKSSIMKLYELKRDEFITEVARSGDVRRAVTRIMIQDPTYTYISSRNLEGVRTATSDLPTSETVLPKLRQSQPRLGWIDQEEVTVANELSARLQANTPDDVVHAVAADLATYEDNFPSQLRNATNTPRMKFLQKASALQPAATSMNGGVARTAARAAQEAGYLLELGTNVMGLIGSGRVGGVVIGQDPKPGSVNVTDVSWSHNGSQTKLWVVTGGRSVELGTFPTSTVHQALAYAADNRRVAVTMVPGSQRLKILLHPALVDTRLGNSIVELDRFVDTYARRDGSPVQRATIIVAAYDALYQRAWQARLLAASEGDPQAKTYIARFDLSPQQQILAQMALADPANIDNKNYTPLAAKTEFYDVDLVNTMKTCASAASADMKAFESCIARSTTPPFSEERFSRMAAPPSAGFPWSVVVEDEYTPDGNFAFVKQARTTLSPFRFALRQVYSSGTIDQFVNQSTAPYTDVTPWDYPNVGGYVQTGIARVVEANPVPKAIVDDARQFAILQRFFRTAIRGQLGPDFPDAKLPILAKETRGAVVKQPTPRWN